MLLKSWSYIYVKKQIDRAVFELQAPKAVFKDV